MKIQIAYCVGNLAPQTRIKLSTMVESSLESSKRFILQRYLAPGMYFVYIRKGKKCRGFSYQKISFQQTSCCASKGYTLKIKRNDFIGICNGRRNSLWWNDANVGGCPMTSDINDGAF